MRIGQGIDIHRFSEDPHRPLVLGGVVIEGARGPRAATATPTPCATRWPTPCWARSAWATSAATSPTPTRCGRAPTASTLLTEVVRHGGGAGLRLSPTPTAPIVADTPRLAPHTAAMVERLSGVLGAPVSVKATRAEGLGALGRAEGIACLAVVLMEQR